MFHALRQQYDRIRVYSFVNSFLCDSFAEFASQLDALTRASHKDVKGNHLIGCDSAINK